MYLRGSRLFLRVAFLFTLISSYLTILIAGIMHPTKMKLSLCLLSLFILAGCNNPSRSKKNSPKDTTRVIAKAHTLQPADVDSVNISTVNTDTIYITRGKLSKILKYYPGLTEEFIEHPDIAYGKRGLQAKEEQDPDSYINFGSEQGQDSYYAIYAYYLKQRNGEYKYTAQRTKLVQLYRDINEIFGRLAQGGTYFGHQYIRILGYAEYSVDLYKSAEKYHDYEKRYKIDKQRTLFINLLKQYINDELDNSYEFTVKEKPALKKQLFETVAHIEGLITEYFYLERAQEFRYSNY
jgi:hypothetical protein